MSIDNSVQPTYDENDPQVQVRTDLWHTMQLPDLVHQRELLMERMNKLSLMLGANTNPTILGMFSAMHLGLNDINTLIDSKSNKKIKG
jgi:hypothetical protein